MDLVINLHKHKLFDVIHRYFNFNSGLAEAPL